MASVGIPFHHIPSTDYQSQLHPIQVAILGPQFSRTVQFTKAQRSEQLLKHCSQTS